MRACDFVWRSVIHNPSVRLLAQAAETQLGSARRMPLRLWLYAFACVRSCASCSKKYFLCEHQTIYQKRAEVNITIVKDRIFCHEIRSNAGDTIPSCYYNTILMSANRTATNSCFHGREILQNSLCMLITIIQSPR